MSVVRRQFIISMVEHDAQIEISPTKDANLALCKGFFIQGLTEARNRNPNTYLAEYIEAYVMVQVNAKSGLLFDPPALISPQFNSILSFRSPAPDSDYYAASWFGPPTT